MSYEYHLLTTINTLLANEFADTAIATAHMLANRYFD